ncbi:MoxR family ATPase [Halobacteria archaeon AArc-m2/3/4]|uniref:MoxR family ATPase n=1 Tax=Natronoglomus mannanivorans TaxID=2979990 RepID=A0ABT2QJ39_9EURY|nr:MoxR family ATPase [Halobacteria archaeon AArc-m2/3/4]
MSGTDSTNVQVTEGNPREVYETLQEEAQRVLVGNDEAIEHLAIALLTRGHVLLEGVPGVAKTTIATIFARATGLDFRRIQMTPDVLPADITGTHIYRESTGEFALQKGPVFTNVVIADEINRATPKTQSALLEAMQERRVTIEGETLSLPDPFVVVATQNPLEMEGVFELPEAQRDRFQCKLQIDLPERDDERQILERFGPNPDLDVETIDQVVTVDALQSAREHVFDVHIADPVNEYILDVVEATRDHPSVEHGASPRATLAFANVTRARAAIHGREYVIPDDVKATAKPVLVHRLILNTDADLSDLTTDDVIEDILATLDAPSAEVAAGGE